MEKPTDKTFEHIHTMKSKLSPGEPLTWGWLKEKMIEAGVEDNVIINLSIEIVSDEVGGLIFGIFNILEVAHKGGQATIVLHHMEMED